MAAGRILGPWNPPRNAAGAIDFAAKLRFFQNNTMTPVAVFNDFALQSSAGVEVTVGVNGLFPTVWTLNRVRVQWLDGAGNQVLLVDDVGPSDFGGADDFVRAFGADGRAQVRGDAGVIQWESGPASPVDTGGAARIGGWNGSGLSSLEFDVTPGGPVTAPGAWTFTEAVEFGQEAFFNGHQVGCALIDGGEWGTNGSGGVVAPSVPLPVEYNLLRLVVTDFNGMTTSGLAQMSADNGATYTAAALYAQTLWRPGNSAPTPANYGGWRPAVVNASNTISSVPHHMDWWFYRERSTNHMRVRAKFSRQGSTADDLLPTRLEGNPEFTGISNRMRFIESSNAFTGRWAVWGYPGLGGI